MYESSCHTAFRHNGHEAGLELSYNAYKMWCWTHSLCVKFNKHFIQSCERNYFPWIHESLTQCPFWFSVDKNSSQIPLSMALS